jgi:hypothetical protein
MLDPEEPMHARPRPRRIGAYLRHELLLPFVAALASSGWAVFALYADPYSALRSTLVAIVVALMAVLYFTGKLVRSWPRLQVLRTLERERLRLCSMLELSVPESKVFGDLWGTGVEVDLVLVCKAGIFTMCIELLPEPPEDQAVAVFDGNFLHVDGTAPIREPVTRARDVARGLGQLLRERMASWRRVTPLLFVPGWEVRLPNGLDAEMIVVGAAQLPQLLQGLFAHLDDEDVAQVCYAMEGIARDAKRRRSGLRRWESSPP